MTLRGLGARMESKALSHLPLLKWRAVRSLLTFPPSQYLHNVLICTSVHIISTQIAPNTAYNKQNKATW